MKCFCEFHVTEDVTYCPSENPERNLCYAQVQSYNINLLRTTQPSLFVAVTHHVFYLLNYCILEYEADAMNLGSYLKAILSSSSFPFVTSFPFFSIFSYRPRYLPSQNTSSMFTGFCQFTHNPSSHFPFPLSVLTLPRNSFLCSEGGNSSFPRSDCTYLLDCMTPNSSRPCS